MATSKTEMLQSREVICELLAYIFDNMQNAGCSSEFEDALVADTVQYLHIHMGMDAAAIASRFGYAMDPDEIREDDES